ncbi:hypothetical protein BJP36_27535 [Moorena producens JHB]|uniref:AMP-dependent synthetase/ligase domain-containing protein n=1 Tax=Moorena producens (strain JHB) TaxID=1454205 RepID=A0A1D9G674_MOOP1|nr:hypothetical protein [Moorena producens]AOY83116.1 hypothetical protein BJP36_27535 [Moorena producens JHB]
MTCVNPFPNSESNFLSLVDLLSEREQGMPDQLAYVFLENGETESGSLSYGELDPKARAYASHLQQWQGERALLLYPSGLELISAFMGFKNVAEYLEVAHRVLQVPDHLAIDEEIIEI